MELSPDHLLLNQAAITLERSTEKDKETFEDSSAGLNANGNCHYMELYMQGTLTSKINKKKKVYRNTRSQRSATVPENATFDLVNVCKRYRPAFIHKPKSDGSTELAQSQLKAILARRCFHFRGFQVHQKRHPRIYLHWLSLTAFLAQIMNESNVKTNGCNRNY